MIRCFSRFWSAILCLMKSLTVSEALGPRFCLGAVMVQMTGFAASSARSVYLCALGCVISLLPVCKKGIQGSGEGSSGTITKSRSLVTNTHLWMSSLQTSMTTLALGLSQTNCFINISLVGPGSTIHSTASRTHVKKISKFPYPTCISHHLTTYNIRKKKNLILLSWEFHSGGRVPV